MLTLLIPVGPLSAPGSVLACGVRSGLIGGCETAALGRTGRFTIGFPTMMGDGCGTSRLSGLDSVRRRCLVLPRTWYGRLRDGCALLADSVDTGHRPRSDRGRWWRWL